MSLQRIKLLILLFTFCASGLLAFTPKLSAQFAINPLDKTLVDELHRVGFTGRIESKLEERLGRPIDRQRAELGRLLFFDTIGGLNIELDER